MLVIILLHSSASAVHYSVHQMSGCLKKSSGLTVIEMQYMLKCRKTTTTKKSHHKSYSSLIWLHFSYETPKMSSVVCCVHSSSARGKNRYRTKIIDEWWRERSEKATLCTKWCYKSEIIRKNTNQKNTSEYKCMMCKIWKHSLYIRNICPELFTAKTEEISATSSDYKHTNETVQDKSCIAPHLSTQRLVSFCG